jgi:hypothetical protein
MNAKFREKFPEPLKEKKILLCLSCFGVSNKKEHPSKTISVA